MITQLLKMKINLLLFLIKFLQRHLINLNQKLNQSKNSRALLMLKKRNKRKNRRSRTKRSISINNKIWRASWTTRSRKQNPFPMWRKRRPLLLSQVPNSSHLRRPRRKNLQARAQKQIWMLKWALMSSYKRWIQRCSTIRVLLRELAWRRLSTNLLKHLQLLVTSPLRIGPVKTHWTKRWHMRPRRV